ncbi:MAG TPA: arylsulfatase [Candidatus Hydrogenedentes bacterium]|nr:arylsulfatase [Candidatus Hydrogenedentota bacterium]HOL76264.1 arylsulfatase [Candidatus Hydrogenedentota bacterium]HPO86803.1 arylsulfatase [Candidatus Hydrogenedentota bacterium]
MTRREFMRVGATATMAAMGGLATASERTPRRRPNFLIILADDLGFSDIGCYGGEIATPNLDRLAGNGIRFTHAYSAARCCPSRAALLTGLNPHQAGMGGMVVQPDEASSPGPYQGYLNNRCITIAEVLREANYSTYMSGKWHVGEAPEHWPRRRGFDRYYGLISGASSYFEILEEERNRRSMALDDTRIWPEGDHFYMTDAFTDFAVQCIKEHPEEKPFLLYLAYTAPHWPLHAWPEDIAKYRGKYLKGWDRLRQERYERLVNMGIIDPRWKLSPRDPEVPPWDDVPDKEEMDLRMAVYAAMIDRMDQGIGRVLEALQARQLAENTVVMFLSDNGGCHEDVRKRNLHKPGTRTGERGSFVSYGRPWSNASNTPFRLHKHWVHEGGIATPFIVHWPAGVKRKGDLVHRITHITDILPTCLELAGVNYPRTYRGNDIQPTVGKSFAGLLRGGRVETHDRLYWEHMGNKAIRDGHWKLVATKTGEWELYNMQEDRTELEDLSTREPKRAAKLLRAWEDWAHETGVV